MSTPSTLSMSTPPNSNFHLPLYFLPRSKRDAMFHFYQFCRYADDIADELGPQDPELAKKALAILRNDVEIAFTKEMEKFSTPMGRKIELLRKQFPVQKENLIEIIDGCEMDLVKKRYQTFDELYQYNYRVASAVGLVSIEIFGYSNSSTKNYAINLGMAFQLTNILRDLREDIDRDRIYIPQEDLKKYAYSEEDLRSGKINQEFFNLMNFQMDRVANYYQLADQNRTKEDRYNLVVAELMRAIYYKIFQKIQKNPASVFQGRVRISHPVKILLALTTYIKNL